jgi:hypothetical protein
MIQVPAAIIFNDGKAVKIYVRNGAGLKIGRKGGNKGKCYLS